MSSDFDNLSIFRNLTRNDMELLKPLLEPYTCKVGTVILEQGKSADYLYVIVTGKVEISYKPYDGQRITVSHVEKAGLFGWSAVVGSELYTSSATAIEDLQAVRIHGSKLRKFCTDHPEAGKQVLEQLASSVSSRWKDANQQVQAILKNGLKNN